MSPSWTYWFSAESDFPCGHQGAFCENSVTALARSKYKLLSWFLVGRCIYGSFTNLSIFGRIGLPICPPGGILWKQRYRSSTFNIKVSFVIFGGKVYIWVRHEPINFRLIRTSHLATRGSNVTTDMKTLIDHIYTDVCEYKSGVAETYYSFHKGVWIACS